MVDRDRLISALMFRNDELLTNDFAWGQQLDGEILNSIQIQGIGDIKLPISIEDVERLKSISQPAPYGKGLNVVVDTTMKKAWEIDASKISGAFPETFFSSTLFEFSTVALNNLQLGWLLEAGFDGNTTIGVHIHKLLLYEVGGHYKRHRDSDLEQGVCSVMILQLPVENGYHGGRLKVDQRSSTKHFECEKYSDSCFFLAAFRSNCEHELEPIKSGWRVTLVVNLVWKNALDVTKIPLPLPDVLELVTEIRKSVDGWFMRSNQATHSHHPHGENSHLSQLAIPGTGANVAGRVNDEPVSTESSSNAGIASEVSITDLIQDFLHKPDPDLKLEDLAHVWQKDAELENNCPLNFQVVASCEKKMEKSSTDMLVFLLEHEYSLTDVCFFGLKGQDLLLARLLLCGNFLDVHLAIMSKQIPEASAGNKFNYEVKMEHWINPSNILMPFKGIRVDARTQLVRDFQAMSRLKCQIVEEDTHREEEELSSKQAVLVIWPRHQTFQMNCIYAFDTLLDQVESQLSTSSHQKSIETLRRILAFCRDEPLTVFGDPTAVPGERTGRLLRLCVFLYAREEGLDLLKLIGTDFAKEGNFEKVFYEGIRSDLVAQQIAEFECRVSGWSACSKLVLRMITAKRLSSQLTFLISLARYLMERCCQEGALKILDLITFLLPKLDSTSISCLGQADIDSFANFVIECETESKTASFQRIVSFTNLFPRLDSYQQCRLVVDLRRRIRFGGIASCMQLYQKMCRALPSCDLHAPGPIKTVIVPVVSGFFQLSDPELVNLLLNKICKGSANQDNELIDVLLSSSEIWKLAASSDLGKSMLSSLIDAQVASVKSILGQSLPFSPESVIEPILESEFAVRNFTKKIRLLENLSQLQFQSEWSELIRDVRITLIGTWIDGLCVLMDRGITDDADDPFQVNIMCFLRTVIKTEKNHFACNQEIISIDFSNFFSKLPTKRLCQLILDLYKMEFSTDAKSVPSCLDLYQNLCRHFVVGDIIPSMSPVIVKIAKCMFWLGDDQSLEVFAEKICNSVPQDKENLLVKKVVSCTSVWPLAITSPPSLNTFYLLLDRRIDFLKTVKMPVFSLAQPRAQLPMYPEVEAFLRSSEENMEYHKLASIFHGRSFAEDVTKLCIKNGWCSLKIQIQGSARKAWCVITKTQDLHLMRMRRYHDIQQDLTDMLALRQDFEFKATKCGSNLKRLASLPIEGSKKQPLVIDISSD